MTEEQLKLEVERIIEIGKGDPEAAHSGEDYLHRQLIKQFCPEWVNKHIDTLNDARFERWCA
jgi:hypothetical protein